MIRKDLILESFKCKLIITLILSISIATLSGITTISANTNDRISNGTCSLDISKDIKIVGTNEKDGKVTTSFSDGSQSVKHKNGTIDLLIPITSSFITDEQRRLLQEAPSTIKPRSFFAIAIIAFKVVSGIATGCYVVQWITNGFDPCMAARQYLGNPRPGKYVVEGNYIPGRVPGCDPMNSLSCNSGYYKYRFIPN